MLSRATHLPGGSHTAVHDVTADEFFSICEEASLELRREPRGIFARVLPPAASHVRSGGVSYTIWWGFLYDSTIRILMYRDVS